MISEPALWWGGTAAACRVCGAAAVFDPDLDREAALANPHLWRCERHKLRNPCAIESCRRSKAVPEGGTLADDQWLCSTHWRRFVPPRSRIRRAYHAHWRRGAKLGWSPKRVHALERFWQRLVVLARRRATDGFVNEAEINRAMGWD